MILIVILNNSLIKKITLRQIYIAFKRGFKNNHIFYTLKNDRIHYLCYLKRI